MAIQQGAHQQKVQQTSIAAYTPLFRKDIVEAGTTWAKLRNDLRAGRLMKSDHGVYWDSGTGAKSAIHALLIALTADSARTVSHRTAASIWGFNDEQVTYPLHLTGPQGQRVKRPGRVVSHAGTVPKEFVRQVLGVRVVSPAWAWLDVALQVSELEALVLADRLLYRPRVQFGRRDSLAIKDDLWKVLDLRGSVRGIRGARQVVELASSYSDSPQETRLRCFMHRAGLPTPRVNPMIRGQDRSLSFQPDLAVDDYLVAIQYEGIDFHSTPEAVRRDVRRAEICEELGWLEVRITKDHMADGGTRALEKIKKALRSRGWPG